MPYDVECSLSFVSSTTIPEKWKTALLSAIKMISLECPTGLQKVLLFGSLARSDIDYKSDIDLCLVFEDDVNLREYNMLVFRSELGGVSLNPSIDTVFCHASQLKTSKENLFRNINRDAVQLYPRPQERAHSS